MKMEISFDSPEMEWKYNVDFFCMVEIMLNRLKKQGKITKRKETKIRKALKPLRYHNWLNSPGLENNKKIKEEIKLLCLNDYAATIGLSKFVRFVNSEDSA